MAELSYIRVFLDWSDLTKKLTFTEKGRLIEAMISYARQDSDAESILTGNESFVFPVFQIQIDRLREELEKKSRTQADNGKLGGRPRKEINPKNPELFEETQKSKEEEKEEDMKDEYSSFSTTSPVMNNSPDIQKILEAWNSLGLQQIKKISNPSTRYNSLKARIREYSPEDVLTAIEKVRNSPFLTGNNSRGWVITFDWFIKPNNFPKVLDGNYDARAISGGKTNNIFLEIAEERAYDGK